MITSFDEQLAVDFDIEIAVFIENLAYWLRLNAIKDKIEQRNFREGRFWSYNSYTELSKLFPCWTVKIIRTVVARCIKNDLILVDTFNKKKYDQTHWYTLSDKAISYLPATEKALLASSVEINMGGLDLYSPAQIDRTPAQMGRPIPKLQHKKESNNINIITKENQKNPKNMEKNAFGVQNMLDDNPHEIPEEHIEQWRQNRGKHKVTKLVWNRINKNLTALRDRGISPFDAFDRMVTAGWRSLELDYFQQQLNKPAGGGKTSQWDVDSVWSA